jgi:hypothetical protein
MLESQFVDIFSDYIILSSYPRTGINLSKQHWGIRPVLHPKRLHMISPLLRKLCVPVGCMMQYKRKKFKENVRSSQAL